VIDDDVSAAITGKTPGSISVQVTKVREATDEFFPVSIEPRG
jgi:hypothetical protein